MADVSQRGASHLLTVAELAEIVACPRCRAPLPLEAGTDVTCTSCGAQFTSLNFGWDLRTPREDLPANEWATWDILQHNGAVSYREDPDHNLGVGEREDYLAFSRFCRLSGLVLDVGCGPQPWPAHFEMHAERTRFVGVDPLVGDEEALYIQLRALGEHLPFRES